MSSSTPDISEVISKLTQNEELSAMVKELRGKEDKGVDGADIMGKLPEIMSMLSPMMGGASGDEQKVAGNVEVKKEPQGESKFNKARATKLMSALKPYLSAERCTMIDKCMSVMQIGDIMSVLYGLNMSGKNGG